MKILNLFAGIGGNRTLWGDEHEITAIEHDQQIAMIYHRRFPNDKIIIEDAYEYIESYYKEFDFIWASPPCQTHSRNMYRSHMKKRLPDFRLYSLIFFLNKWFKGLWVVENVAVIDEMIPHNAIIGRHYIWSNFPINNKKFHKLVISRKYIGSNGKKHDGGLSDLTYSQLREIHKIKDDFSHPNKKSILRNCVDHRIGKYILDSINTKTLEEWIEK